jgi:hypothetical protein
LEFKHSPVFSGSASIKKIRLLILPNSNTLPETCLPQKAQDQEEAAYVDSISINNMMALFPYLPDIKPSGQTSSYIVVYAPYSFVEPSTGQCGIRSRTLLWLSQPLLILLSTHHKSAVANASGMKSALTSGCFRNGFLALQPV